VAERTDVPEELVTDHEEQPRSGIVPNGPILNLDEPHDRQRVFG
jgi:hypothetical protein